MFDPKLAESEYWTVWAIVPVLTIMEAAWLLAGFDPGNADKPNTAIPSSVAALKSAMLQAERRGTLVVEKYFEGSRIGSIELNHKRDSADDSTIEVRREELAKWADKQQISHLWSVGAENAASGSSKSMSAKERGQLGGTKANEHNKEIRAAIIEDYKRGIYPSKDKAAPVLAQKYSRSEHSVRKMLRNQKPGDGQ